MTPHTHQLIAALQGVTYLPGSTDKKFVRQMKALSIDAELTEKQLLYLGQIAYRFRKQLHHSRQVKLDESKTTQAPAPKGKSKFAPAQYEFVLD